MTRSVDGITAHLKRTLIAPVAPIDSRKKSLRFKPSVRRVAYVARYPLLACTLALIAIPFLPELQFKMSTLTKGVTTANAMSDQVAGISAPSLMKPGHWLVIPQMNLDTEILEGASDTTVDKGIWRKPTGSIPGQAGNTILLGHRFEYTTKENYFYHLDKIKSGDVFTVDWDNHTYTYKVTEIRVVAATDVSIELPTAQPTLTLYTCTPLLTGSERLVVRAVPAS